jgi:succinyl-diaminopimelate desuccinylase
MEDIFRKLVSFHTVTGDTQSVHEALDYIATFVAQRGMHIERFESGGYESLVATVTPGHKTPKVMLAAHLDVVPAPDEMFELRKENGRFYGRGVLDMKFALAAYLQLVDELQDNLQNYDIGLIITSDEEVGGKNGAAELIKEGYRPEVCVLPDGGDDWQVQVHSKGVLWLKIAAHGKPAHASRPWLGKSAFVPLLKVLHDSESLFPENNAQSNTYNLGHLTGGTAENQVVDYAEALLDIRVMSEGEKAKLLEETRAICHKHGAELTVTLDGAACEFDLENPYIAPFVRLITEVAGVEVKGAHTLGTSDVRYYAAEGIPCISVYPTGAGHHGPEEWISEQAVYQFKDILGQYLEKIARR